MLLLKSLKNGKDSIKIKESQCKKLIEKKVLLKLLHLHHLHPVKVKAKVKMENNQEELKDKNLEKVPLRIKRRVKIGIVNVLLINHHH